MNSENILLLNSPLSDVTYEFGKYLTKTKAAHTSHMLGNGVTDYAYKTDLELRKKLDSIPGVYNAMKKICSSLVAQEIQLANMQDLAVGPQQFPEIYGLACDCAKRLSIAIPHIYIRNSEEMNAFTYACDDVEPFIVIYTPIIKRFTLGEIKCVIAHECGHIHNYHTVYSTISSMLLEMGANAASSMAGALLAEVQLLMTYGIQMTLNMWSRAAEVTADRAALICCDSLEDAYSVNKKFLYGGHEMGNKITTELSIESLKEQMQESMNNPTGVIELFYDHPLSIKRIFAEMEFAQCDIFYRWRPDLKQAGAISRSKEIVDERCKKYIDVVHKKGDKK